MGAEAGSAFTASATRYSRVNDVALSGGCSRPLIYKRIEAGLHVGPVQIHSRTSVFPDDEIEAQRKAEIFGLSEPMMRQVVALLEERRKHILDDDCPTPLQIVRYVARLKAGAGDTRVAWESFVNETKD